MVETLIALGISFALALILYDWIWELLMFPVWHVAMFWLHDCRYLSKCVEYVCPPYDIVCLGKGMLHTLEHLGKILAQYMVPRATTAGDIFLMLILLPVTMFVGLVVIVVTPFFFAFLYIAVLAVHFHVVPVAFIWYAATHFVRPAVVHAMWLYPQQFKGQVVRPMISSVMQLFTTTFERIRQGPMSSHTQCPKCSKILPTHIRFCAYCGTAVIPQPSAWNPVIALVGGGILLAVIGIGIWLSTRLTTITVNNAPASTSYRPYTSSSQSVPQSATQSSSRKGIFSSLNTSVTTLRFFESGSDVPPHNQIAYAQRFARSKTRYINWELNLKHLAPGHRLDFSINEVWSFADGRIFKQQSSRYLEGHWTSSHYVSGLGWGNAGNWPVGSYRVDLHIENKKIASGSFEIYEDVIRCTFGKTC